MNFDSSHEPNLDLVPVPNSFHLYNGTSSSTGVGYGGYDPRITSIRCFADTPMSFKGTKVYREDYNCVLNLILTNRVAMEDRGVFSGWRADTCDISLVGQKPFNPPAFPLMFLGHVAASIATRCLTEEKRKLGGVARLFGVESTMVFTVRNADTLTA